MFKYIKGFSHFRFTLFAEVTEFILGVVRLCRLSRKMSGLFKHKSDFLNRRHLFYKAPNRGFVAKLTFSGTFATEFRLLQRTTRKTLSKNLSLNRWS